MPGGDDEEEEEVVPVVKKVCDKCSRIFGCAYASLGF